MKASICAVVAALALSLPPGAPAHAGADEASMLIQKDLYREGKYAEALPLAQKSLALREKEFGPDHPDVAQALNNLAGFYRDQGRHADAEQLRRRAIAIRQAGPRPI